MKRYLIIIGLMVLAVWGKGQVTNYIPPSPVSAEFAKYINFDVALYHGIPEISIPLYDIKLKGLTIPINLTYHASGIKFGQESGDVGLGWVLNPGYRISRNILGYADELYQMPTNYSGGWNDLLIGHGKLETDQILSQFIDDDPFTNIDGKIDGEFDEFTFSLPNTGGGFVITDRTNHGITSDIESNMKFDYVVANCAVCSREGITAKGIKGFRLTDEQGIKYYFGDYLPQTTCVNEIHAQTGGLLSTAWGITNIITPTGDEVKIKYVQGTVGGSSCSRNLTVKEAHSFFSRITSEVSESEKCSDYYYTFFPSEITTPNERVVFNRLSQSNRISNIQIFSLDGVLYKKIVFYYNSGSYTGGSFFTNNYTVLDHITMTDNNEQPVETYNLDYYPCSSQNQYLPDEFGYIMSCDPSKYLHSDFENDLFYIQYNIDESNLNGYIHSEYPLKNIAGATGLYASRATEEIPSFLSLKKITYPTKGYTEYEYEKNIYTDEINSPTQKAGIRISKITSSDPLKGELLSRTYKYGLNECGYGKANFMVNYKLFVKETPYMNFLDYYREDANLAQKITTYSTNMQGDASIVACQSGFVQYPCVTEYYSSSVTGNGKTEYLFNIGSLYDTGPLYVNGNCPRGKYQTYPRYILTYSPWNKPYLHKKTIFDKNNNPLKVEEFQYDQSETFSLTGFKVRPFASTSDEPISNFSIDPGHSSYCASRDNYCLPTFFDYGSYTFKFGKKELLKKTETEYFAGGSFTNEYSYEYSNLLLSKETIKRSSGDKLIHYTSYPLDYAAGESFIDNMTTNGLIAYPIERLSYLDNGTSQNILSGTITKYKIGGKGLPDSQLNLENDLPISLTSFNFSNRSINKLPPSGTKVSFSPNFRYAKEFSFDNYDDKSNLTKILSKNGIYTYYIWAYNKTYPVAKIESSVNTTINITVDDTQLKKTTVYADIQSDVTYLKGLFNSYLTNKDYQVTLYTYKPLVGMTSQTDPAGRTTYYEYDDFGRLKLMKDLAGNILKKYEYHYAGQN